MFLAENVKGLTTHDNGRTIQTMVDVFEELGYKVSMDKFYEIVTGDKEAFYKMCIELPTIISETSKERFEILTKMIKEELKDKWIFQRKLNFKSYEE